MYGSSLHAEVICLAQPSSVKLSHLDSATSLARFSFARCTVVQLGLHMDSPSQQQRRIAHVDPSTSDTQAFRHNYHHAITNVSYFTSYQVQLTTFLTSTHMHTCRQSRSRITSHIHDVLEYS